MAYRENKETNKKTNDIVFLLKTDNLKVLTTKPRERKVYFRKNYRHVYWNIELIKIIKMKI